MTKKTKQWLIWIGVALFLILLLAIVIKDYMPELRLFADPHGIDQVKLEAMVRSHGLKDMFILGLMIMVMCAVPGMSNAVICVVAGICYGPVIGFLLNWSGDVVGNVLSSYLLNKLHLKAHSARIQQLISNNHPKVMMTLGYMIPFIPSVGLNYAAAVRHVPKKDHLLIIMIGMIPTALLYALGGDAILKVDWKRLIIVTVIIIALIGINYLLIKEFRKHHRAGQQVD